MVGVCGPLRGLCCAPRRRAQGTLGDGATEEFVASVRQAAQARANERLMHEFAYHEMLPEL